MLQVVYHPEYLNYSFGKGHPFWPERAKIFLNQLKKSNLRYRIHEPQKATDSEITLVHTDEYLKRVKRLAETGGSLSIDTPVDKKVVEAAYYTIGGSILATNLALKGKRVINLLGGLHHAGISDSSGFCIFNDHAIAIRKLQKEGKIRTAFVFDVDVHAGQGTQEIFYKDPSVFTLSIHQDPRTIYPGTGFPEQKGEGEGAGYNHNILLTPGAREEEFLQAVKQGIKLHNNFNPDLTILVLGVDTFKEDPLANIKLELKTYEKLGRLVNNIKKLAVLCAGGYSSKVPEIWLYFIKCLLKI